EPSHDRVGSRESHLVPADLGDALPLGEPADPAGEPAEASSVAFLAVVEEHLQADADAEERNPVVLHAPGERVEEVGLAQRVERGRRRAGGPAAPTGRSPRASRPGGTGSRAAPTHRSRWGSYRPGSRPRRS